MGSPRSNITAFPVWVGLQLRYDDVYNGGNRWLPYTCICVTLLVDDPKAERYHCYFGGR